MHSTITRRELLAALFLHRLVAQDTTFSTEVNVVTVLASVRTKQGEIVKDLNKDDFVVEEDGRPQALKYFTRETNLPLTLGLLIDTSGSQRRLIGAERSASFRFFQQVLRENKDMAFVLHFDREIELLQDLTSSRKKLQESLALLDRQPDFQQRGGGGGNPTGARQRGGTAVYDAVLLGSDELMQKQAGRKAHILLSDGVDNASKVTIGTAIESSQRADTLVYSILFEDREAYGQPQMRPQMGGRGRRGGGRAPMPQQRQMPNGKKVLQQLSRETGGGFFEVTKKMPLEKVFDHIEEELRNQYSLGYTSDQKGAGFRKISVTTKQKGLVVQARQSYYASK